MTAARGLGCVVFFGSESLWNHDQCWCCMGAGEAFGLSVRLQRRPALPLLTDLTTILQGIAQILAKRCAADRLFLLSSKASAWLRTRSCPVCPIELGS